MNRAKTWHRTKSRYYSAFASTRHLRKFEKYWSDFSNLARSRMESGQSSAWANLLEGKTFPENMGSVVREFPCTPAHGCYL